MIKTMDKASVKMLAEKAEEALEALAQEMGVTFKRGNGSYDYAAGTFSFKGEFGVEGSGRSKFERDVKYLFKSGLTADDYEREFTSKGKRFKIVGINLRAPKYPVQATCLDDGRSYKFPETSVRLALASSPIGVA
jgi:hypothetical protein